MNNHSEIKKTVEQCNACGGNLRYSPQHKALFCNKCGSIEKIQITRNFVKHDFNVLAENKKEYNEWKQKNKIFKCSSCGASMVLNSLDLTSTCPYCGSNYATEKTEVAGLCPDAIIPFKFSNEKASELYRQGLKKKWFVPNVFKKKPPIDEVTGQYINCFSYDQFTSSNYNGKLATDHTRTDSNGHRHTTTTYKHISGTKNMQHSNILVETSSHIDQNVFASLKPYNLNELVDYKNEFILGFSVEHYDQALDLCKKIADDIIDERIRSTILSGYSYDRVCYLDINTARGQQKFAYYLVPTYKFDYTYKNKKYSTYMNGQTGKIGLGVPKSATKITFFVLGILAIIGAIIAFVNIIA